MLRSAKSKEERACLAEFFKEQVSKVDRCENCGIRIGTPSSKNVAHILPKEKFKSVMCEPENVLLLCTDLDRGEGKGCHDLYDSSWSTAKSMPIWGLAVTKFRRFQHKILEKSLTLLNFTDA